LKANAPGRFSFGGDSLSVGLFELDGTDLRRELT
jgi:hypothetical protein